MEESTKILQEYIKNHPHGFTLLSLALNKQDSLQQFRQWHVIHQGTSTVQYK
jgi:hypothetical protein